MADGKVRVEDCPDPIFHKTTGECPFCTYSGPAAVKTQLAELIDAPANESTLQRVYDLAVELVELLTLMVTGEGEVDEAILDSDAT